MKSSTKTNITALVIILPIIIYGTVILRDIRADSAIYNEVILTHYEATTAAPAAEIVTGLCTFGDCPVSTTIRPTEPATPDTIADTTFDTTPDTTVDDSLVTPTELVEVEYAGDTSGGFIVTCWVTAYCGCWECSGEYGPYDVFENRCIPNHTIGVDPSVIPYGTQVEINGIVYTASDTGSAINGYEIDVYHETHAECEAWLTGYYDVRILG